MLLGLQAPRCQLGHLLPTAGRWERDKALPVWLRVRPGQDQPQETSGLEDETVSRVPGTVVHACNPGTKEVEAGGS